MSRPLVSVVMASYQRRHLLLRSLVCYEKQEFDNSRFELVVVDDSSTDGTDDLVRSWSHDTGIRAVVLTPHPKRTGWRDCGAIINYGIRASSGHHVIITHPEVMPGKKSVAHCVDALERSECGRLVKEIGGDIPPNPIGIYACCKVYYMGPRDQELIDSVPWSSKGVLAVRDIPGFYDEDSNGNPDYTHRATDSVAQPGSRLPTWESWVFGGCSRETWKRLGGMLVTQRWGSVDIAFLQRRRTLGIPNHTCPDDETIVVHQNHDLPTDTKTPRVEQAWKDELKNYDMSPQRLMYPGVDELGW